jgi:hypothetical protein
LFHSTNKPQSDFTYTIFLFIIFNIHSHSFHHHPHIHSHIYILAKYAWYKQQNFSRHKAKWMRARRRAESGMVGDDVVK